MNYILKHIIACAVLVLLAASAPAIVHAKGGASQGRGRGEEKGEWKADKAEQKAESKAERAGIRSGGKTTPYGWSQGRKTGWRGGSTPPGWSKWNKDRREGWKRDRVESIEEIDRHLVRYKFPDQQSGQIIGAFDQAIAGGMAIDDARKKIVSGLKDRHTRRNLMVDAAQESLDLLR